MACVCAAKPERFRISRARLVARRLHALVRLAFPRLCLGPPSVATHPLPWSLCPRHPSVVQLCQSLGICEDVPPFVFTS
jgi:hypothetical protein